MNKCLQCGCVFESEDTSRWYERHGFDSPPYEEFCGCPECGGDFETDVDKCDGCREAFFYTELYNGYCANCVKDEFTFCRGKEFLEHMECFGLFVGEMFCNNEDGSENEDALRTLYDDLLQKNGTDWMEAKMKEWVFDDEDWGCEHFSDWLYKNGGKSLKQN